MKSEKNIVKDILKANGVDALVVTEEAVKLLRAYGLSQWLLGYSDGIGEDRG